MKKITFPTLCLMAAVAASPALAGPSGKAHQPRPYSNSECTFQSAGKAQPRRQARRHAEPMDCIVVKGYPSRDSRAVLRRSLKEKSKENLSKIIRTPSLKEALGTDRTS